MTIVVVSHLGLDPELAASWRSLMRVESRAEGDGIEEAFLFAGGGGGRWDSIAGTGGREFER